MRDFPSDFLWGAATAGHQVEGGNTNSNWWAFEHKPDTPVQEPSGDAIDHLHRYDSDFALLGALGYNAHRFSFEWSRIEPAAGEFSSSALDHYKRVLESLHRHGMTPFGTLNHFTIPQWFAHLGGWMSPQAVDLFARYVEKVVGVLGDLTPYVGTINEPQVVALMGYLNGGHAPGIQDLEQARQVNRVLAAAHRRAVEVVRAGAAEARVGTCLAFPYIEPVRPDDEADLAVAARMRAFFIDTHVDDLRAAADPGDFVGIQYYSRDRADGTSPVLKAPPPEGAELTRGDWEVYPAGFGHVLRDVATVGLPVIVTENGVDAVDDTQRVRYLSSHLRELKSALDDGVDVRGYFHWSAFDDYEWGTYEGRFGLVGIDREDGFRRYVRASAVYYGEVARTGRLAALDAVAAAVS